MRDSISIARFRASFVAPSRSVPSECQVIRIAEIRADSVSPTPITPQVRDGRYRFRFESEDRVKNHALGRKITQGARLFRPAYVYGAPDVGWYKIRGLAIGPDFANSPKTGPLEKEVFRELPTAAPIRCNFDVRRHSLQTPGGVKIRGSALPRVRNFRPVVVRKSWRAFATGSLSVTSISDICDAGQISRGGTSPGTPRIPTERPGAVKWRNYEENPEF